MLTPFFPLFPVIAGLGAILVLVPLPWHAEAWNTGTCYFMIWTALACLNQLVNSIVWADNVNDVAPVWCDISTRIILGASVGIPASALCINRRLYSIARCQSVGVSRGAKRRAILIDSLICVLFPVLYMAMAYVVTGHRYNILENIGCYPAIYNTLPAYFLVNMWPVLIGVISGGFGIMAIRYLLIRRAAFNEYLAGSGSMTSSRYFRLMAIATTELVFSTPLGIYEIYSNVAAGPISPWISWEDTHYNFSHVTKYPAIFWRQDPTLAVPIELTRWLLPLCGLIFFVFFGFADEARRNYHVAAHAITAPIVRLCAIRKRQKGSSKLKTLQLPSSSKATFMTDDDSISSKPAPSPTSSIATLSSCEYPEKGPSILHA